MTSSCAYVFGSHNAELLARSFVVGSVIPFHSGFVFSYSHYQLHACGHWEPANIEMHFHRQCSLSQALLNHPSISTYKQSGVHTPFILYAHTHVYVCGVYVCACQYSLSAHSWERRQYERARERERAHRQPNGSESSEPRECSNTRQSPSIRVCSRSLTPEKWNIWARWLSCFQIISYFFCDTKYRHI